MFLIASGVALLPVALRGAKGASIRLHALTIDVDQEALLAEMVETLIPATHTPGAKELNIHLFVLKMIDDCHDTHDQKLFVQGLVELDKLAKQRFGNGFIACKDSQRKELLESLKRKKGVSADMHAFNAMVKKRAIQGYLNSKYVMVHLRPHRMIPDPYNGYYPASNYKS